VTKKGRRSGRRKPNGRFVSRSIAMARRKPRLLELGLELLLNGDAYRQRTAAGNRKRKNPTGVRIDLDVPSGW
jgi:hypothetical protein